MASLVALILPKRYFTYIFQHNTITVTIASYETYHLEISPQFLLVVSNGHSILLVAAALISLSLQDIIDMRNELARKDDLLKKHADKLNEWQGLLSSMQTRLGTSNSVGPRPPGPPGPPVPTGPTMHPGMMASQPVSHQSVPMPGLSPVGGGSMGPSPMGPTGVPPMQHAMNNPNMGMPQTTMMQASIVSNVTSSSSSML